MKSTAVTNLTFVKQGTSIKGSIAKPTARPAISRSAFAAAALGPQKLHFENDTLTRTMEEIVILAHPPVLAVSSFGICITTYQSGHEDPHSKQINLHR